MHHNENHDHQHEHKHDHGNHQDHHHDHKNDMAFDEKMSRLLDHWISHNADHARSYRDWAAKAKENSMDDVAALLEESAELTLAISKKFEDAMDKIS
ncbi:hypothetical protein QUF76_13900 [Desulfobacterales bacterium HSG16]|nr:hypothetical protein [Desulfobacterales bacterium HSG16]